MGKVMSPVGRVKMKERDLTLFQIDPTLTGAGIVLRTFGITK
jgi:hypothetical protein